MIRRVGGKAGDGVAVVTANHSAVGGTGDGGAGAPVHVHAVVVAVVVPGDGGLVVGDIVHLHVGRTHAAGGQLKGDIVEHHVDV